MCPPTLTSQLDPPDPSRGASGTLKAAVVEGHMREEDKGITSVDFPFHDLR